MSLNASMLLHLNVGVSFPSSRIGVGLTDSLLTNRICKRDVISVLVIKGVMASFLSSFCISPLMVQEASSPLVRTHQQPFEEVRVSRNEGPCLQPSRGWGFQPTAMGVSHLGSKSSSPSQALIGPKPQTTSWPQPHERPWTRITQLNSSQILS